MSGKFFKNKASEVPAYLDTIEDRGHLFVVRLKGSLDMNALQADREKMTNIINKLNLYSKNILVDLKKVSQTDSATIAALLDRLIDIDKHQHKIGFFNIPAQFIQLIEVLKVSHNFLIYQTEDIAVSEHK